MKNKKADGSTMDSYTYTYYAAHNQLSKNETINGVAKGTTSYTYDDLNRIETVTEPSTKVTAYDYDAAGNRTSESVTLSGNTTITTYDYNEQNRLLSTTTIPGDGVESEIVQYGYDNNGNMVYTAKETLQTENPDLDEGLSISIAGEGSTEDVTFNEYDVWNQLVTTTLGDQTLTYKYNGEGYRVEKTLDGVVTRYLYEYDKVILEVDGSNNQIARNVYGANLLVRTAGVESYYYMYNGHADVTALMNAAGQVAASYYYDAFGNILEETGTVDNPYRYAGYQYDEETGNYYLNSRMYDPKIARFLQEDTFRGSVNDPLSLNLYTYCNNEPIMYTDPTGHTRKGDELLPEELQYELKYWTEMWAKAQARNDAKGMKAAHEAAEKIWHNFVYANYEGYTGDSITDFFKGMGLRGSKQDRIAMADAIGMVEYKANGAQNIAWMNSIRKARTDLAASFGITNLDDEDQCDLFYNAIWGQKSTGDVGKSTGGTVSGHDPDDPKYASPGSGNTYKGTGNADSTPSNPFGDKWFISADDASILGLTTPSSNKPMGKELEGFGIQIALSGSIPGFTGAIGAEIVWYINDSFERNEAGLYTNKSEAIPYIYVFVEGDTGGSMTKSGVDYLIASIKDIVGSPNVALRNIKNLAGFSASVTAFGIVGNNRFNNPYDYLGAFNTTSATVCHVKGTYATDPNHNVVTVGVGADTSYFGFFQGASNYYMLNPAKLEGIANSLSGLMDTASKEYKEDAQQ